MNWLAYLILPFAAIDALLKRLFHGVLVAIGALTGWDNRRIAGLGLFASVIILATEISVSNLQRQVPVLDLTVLTLLLIGQANSHRSYRSYHELKDPSERTKLWWDIAVFRHTLVVLFIFDLITQGIASGLIFWLPLLAPHYFATDRMNQMPTVLSHLRGYLRKPVHA